MWCLCMLLSIHHKYQMGNVRTYGISKYATINCRHGNRCLQNKCHEMRRWQSMSFIIVFFRNWWIHFEYREMEYYDEVMELKNKQPTAVPSVGADIHRTDEEISKTIESIEVRRGRIRFGIFFNQSIRYCIVRMWLDQVLNHRQHHVSPPMNERRESHPNRNRNQRARITQNTQPKVSTTSSGTSWRCRRKLRIYFSTSPGECLPLSLQRMSHADDGAFFSFRYSAPKIDITYTLQPFVPDFIPAVGDIDAFLKVNAPQPFAANKNRIPEFIDKLGLEILDEPCGEQSEPALLHMKLRSISTTNPNAPGPPPSVSKSTRDVEKWITEVQALRANQPYPTVVQNNGGPDIDALMVEWPAKMEQALNTIGFPSANLKCSLQFYIEMVCGLFDIPLTLNNEQTDYILSLNTLFNLYLAVKNPVEWSARFCEGNYVFFFRLGSHWQ